MNDILETQSYKPLQKEQLNEVMKDEKAHFHSILKMHDLEKFRMVEIQADNDFQDHEYLLYARNLRAVEARRSSTLKRRST